MARWKLFTIRVNDEERQLIAILAERLQRTQSDAIRLIIREAAKELIKNDPQQLSPRDPGGDG